MGVLLQGPWKQRAGKPVPGKCACGYDAIDAYDLDEHMISSAFSGDPEGTHHETRN